MEEVYTDKAVSDKEGKYKFIVHDDHRDQMCDVLLVKSSDKTCSKISVGREKSRVILNHYSGIASQIRHANNMAKGSSLFKSKREIVRKSFRYGSLVWS